MTPIEHIVVAIDFSEPSQSALTYARVLASHFGAALHLLHVVENRLAWGSIDGATQDVAAIQIEAQESARFKLNALLSDRDRRLWNSTADIRIGNSPAREIIAHANALRADIIVMGTHGRGLVTRLLMGSVAAHVINHAPCPVLTVKHPEHEAVGTAVLEVALQAGH